MKKKIFIFLFSLFLVFIIIKNVFAGTNKNFIFVIKNRIYNLDYKIFNSKLYINLRDLAKIFNLPILFNLNKGVIYIDSKNTENLIDLKDIKSVKSNLKSLLYGQVLYKKLDFFIPVTNVSLKLFKSDKDYPLDIQKEQYKLYILQNDNWWQQTHGLVRKSMTDKNGYFYFYNLPYGSYVLVGFVKFNGKRIIWLKKINILKGKRLKINFLINRPDMVF